MSFDVHGVLQQAKTARGTSLLSAHELATLHNHVSRLGQTIHSIEAYELRDDAEIARPDLSLYGDGGPEDVEAIITAAAKESSEVGFQVWVP
ncbi:MAG: hypothetical protein ACXU82_16075 [Caulobacteraceae bacterium]